MWLSLLLAGVFATLTSACVFPFNNPRLTNGSLLAGYVADLQSKNGNGGEDGGGNGWVTVIGQDSDDPIPWPVNGHTTTKLTYIYYCYASHKDFATLNDVVNEAAGMWRNKLGHGHQNGHRFDGFRLYWDRKTNSHPRCYNDHTDKDQRTWNPLVPEGTLVIEISDTDHISWATLGYIDKDIDSDPDRHIMQISKEHDHWVLVVAHELGHVLGLVHEHQRYDRDKYVNFDCTKLEGYNDAKSKIERNNWGFSIDDACKSNWLGMSEGLDWAAPSQFSLDMGDGRGQHGGSNVPYDHHSIMQYPSVGFAAFPIYSIKDLPLVRWKRGPPSDGKGVDEFNADIILRASSVSDGDKDGIQYLYPWLGW